MENLPMYILITIMMVMLPGTDTVLVMKNTLSHGIKGGQSTIVGIATGLLLWMVVIVLGLSTIVAKSVVMFEIIKYIGGAYLFYLGIKTFISKKLFSLDSNHSNNSVVDKSTINNNRSCFIQGALSNLLNPKTVIFYMTFLPQFINANENAIQQLILLSSILIFCAILWFLILVFILNHIRKWFKNSTFQNTFQKLSGIMLILLGVRLVIEKGR